MYNSFIQNVQSRQIYRDRKYISNCQGLEGLGRKCRVTANIYGFTFGGDDNVLKLTEVMVAKLCEYTKNHNILYFK